MDTPWCKPHVHMYACPSELLGLHPCSAIALSSCNPPLCWGGGVGRAWGESCVPTGPWRPRGCSGHRGEGLGPC